MLAHGSAAQAYEYVRCTTSFDVVNARHMLGSSCTGFYIEKALSGSSMIPSKPKILRKASRA